MDVCGNCGAPTTNPTASLLAAVLMQAAHHGQQLCALGFHAFTPWLAIRYGDDPQGRILRYETFCTRCKHPEQFDV